jgi:hypothetical protein
MSKNREIKAVHEKNLEDARKPIIACAVTSTRKANYQDYLIVGLSYME